MIDPEQKKKIDEVLDNLEDWIKKIILDNQYDDVGYAIDVINARETLINTIIEQLKD